MQERIGDRVLDHDVAAGPRILELAPRAAVDRLRSEFLLRQRIRPVAEAALGELHDVALVHDGHRFATVVDRVLDGFSHQALGALARDRLDADSRRCRKADFLDGHVVDQKVHHLLDCSACR